MNMFKKTKATSVAGYIKSLSPERKADILALHKFIKTCAPSLKSHFAYNMLGYGSFPYVNYKKEQVSWPVIALASQKNYISLYVCALDGKQYLAEKYKAELGKVSVGKSCIRFRGFAGVVLPTLKKIIQLAAKRPGLNK